MTFMNGSSRYAVEVVADGNKVVAPIKPAAPEGMKFAGWYTDKALSEKYEFGSPLPQSIILYAGFEPITYTVQYDGGAEFGLMVNFKTHGVDLTLAGKAFYRDGFVHIGWLGSDGEFYELGGVYSTDADVTLYPVYDRIITLTVPFTTTVKQGGDAAPGETTFDLAIVGANTGEENYADVVVSGSVTTNGAGDYDGTLTFTGPERQLWYMLSEGAFVQQVNGGEENWTYDDTVYGLLLTQGAAYATDDAASPYTVLILPAISVETDDGVRYDIDWDAIDWNAPQSEDMRFTNTYTKSTTEPGTPDTGDNSNPTLWFALLAVSGVGAAGAAIYSRKRKYSAE